MLELLALLPLCASGCLAAVAGGAAAGFILSNEVQNKVRVAQVALDVDDVWPSVTETMRIYQSPGGEIGVQDAPSRTIHAQVSGADVLVEVDALDLGRTTIRVTATKYLVKDGSTADEVMNGILEHLGKLEKAEKSAGK